MSVVVLASFALACGARSGIETADGGVPPLDIVGRVVATTEAHLPGQSLDRFDVDLQPFSQPSSNCPGATMVLGDCCYFAPAPRPSTRPPGSGGAPATETSAGAITLRDATSSTDIGTFNYAAGIYAAIPASYTPAVWQPGDTLTVSALGDQVSAFTVSAPALTPPIASVPSSIAAGEDVVITWEPDSNAETMMIQLLDSSQGAVAACIVPDAQGTVTIPSSLRPSFASGDRCQVATERSARRYAQTPSGRVQFVTVGWASYSTAVP